MKACFMLVALLACSAPGCAMASDVPDPEESDSLPATSGGGRWSAALEPVGDSHRLLVQDDETGNVYEPFELYYYYLQSYEWISKNEIEAQLAGGPLRIRIEPPESEGGSAQFFMVPDPDRPRGEGEIENPPGFEPPDAPPGGWFATDPSYDPRRDEKQRNQRIIERREKWGRNQP